LRARLRPRPPAGQNPSANRAMATGSVVEASTALWPLLLTFLHREIGGEVRGYDTEGRVYASLTSLWRWELDGELSSGLPPPLPDTLAAAQAAERQPASSPAPAAVEQHAIRESASQAWYGDGFDYWESEENCPSSDQGVLGGFAHLSPLDARDSHAFLDALATKCPELRFDVAADCGAGIGRVSKVTLLPRFGQVYLVEQSPRLLAAAPEYIGDPDASRARFIRAGLQEYNPPASSLDVVWVQWVVGHLHDLDLVRFLRRMGAALRPGGLVVIKDNVANPEEPWTFVMDREDRSITRSREYLVAVCRFAGFEVVLEHLQRGFDEGLFPVPMIALRKVREVGEVATAGGGDAEL